MKKAVIVVSALLVVGLAGAIVELSSRSSISSQMAEYDSYENRDGKREATADIARGEPKWKVYGLYRGYDENSQRLKPLGVQVDWFAGCVVSEAILRYSFTYNTTVHAHFVELVGPELTEEVHGPKPSDPRL